MTALRHLTLSRNELGAAGAAALAPLQHLTTLHTLCLSSNNLEAAGATALAQWLHHLTALRSLDQSAHARPPTMSGAQAGGGGSQKGQCNLLCSPRLRAEPSQLSVLVFHLCCK